jgi:hypothetical protein
MRQTLFFILTLIHFSVSCFGQKTTTERLEKFNAFLGADKAAALNDAVDSFDRFLQTNYSEFDNSSDRYVAFLKQIAEHNAPNERWVSDTNHNSEIIDAFESTGLRKEIWLYGYESYESDRDFSKVLPPPEPKDSSKIKDLGELHLELIIEDSMRDYTYDSAAVAKMEKEWEERRRNSLHTNIQGDYLYSILKYAPKDSFAYGAAEGIYQVGNLSPGVVSHGFLENIKNFDDPFVKRLMITEFYFELVIFR